MKLSPLFSLALLQGSSALPSRHIPEFLASLKRPPTVHLTQEEDGDVQTLHLQQKLDHFDNGSDETFSQRYFYTNRYIHDTDGPTAAFLCVGGEGPSLQPNVLIDSVHCTGDMIGLADKLYNEHGWSVLLFALEHRYYGDSFPEVVKDVTADTGGDGSSDEGFPDLSDLTHLSSRQAVQDIISFVQSPQVTSHLKKTTSSTNSNEIQWITFGGSYPGMLSAWSRLLHPTVISGAVSSSAPVQPELDFMQYYNHVWWDLGLEAVGGSDECRDIFVKGHEEIASVLEGKSLPEDAEEGEDVYDYVARLFGVCDGGDTLRQNHRNVETFLGDGVVSVPAQGNDASCEKELCNIEKLCDEIVTQHQNDPNKPPMQILASVSEIKNDGYCSDVSWSGYLDYFSDPTPHNANDRSWMYQTCTEFGFYQTCPIDSQCPFAKGYHNVDKDLELCQSVFGINADDVKASIASTLKYYGGWKLTRSAEATRNADTIPSSGPHGMLRDGNHGEERILFVNGDVDPWTELTVSELQGDTNSDWLVINVPGASHHFWTHKIQESDDEAVVAARGKIYDVVSEWLGVSSSASGIANAAMAVE